MTLSNLLGPAYVPEAAMVTRWPQTRWLIIVASTFLYPFARAPALAPVTHQLETQADVPRQPLPSRTLMANLQGDRVPRILHYDAIKERQAAAGQLTEFFSNPSSDTTCVVPLPSLVFLASSLRRHRHRLSFTRRPRICQLSLTITL
jgi:hypothetical protein